MKLGAAPRIMIVAGVCVAALIGLVVNEGAARANGLEIVLPIEAVDPRSVLSGHYVVINPTERLEAGDTCPDEGDWTWVALRPEGRIHTVAGGARSREQAQLLGPLPAKGTFQCQPPREGGDGFPGWLRVDLGIDRFHINQTDAERIEDVLRGQGQDEPTRAFAIVSVGRDGRARLVGLEIDGERLELRWL